jgi:glycosyltransferase involved in cell wall biosynthesis
MKISVFITSYNQKRFLVEAIESVLSQTLFPQQIIIIDDHSRDASQEVIAEYASCYPDLILPIYHNKNRGVTQTRIEALQAVSGDYVTYVDGDDRFLPTKLEKEAQALEKNPKAKIAFSNNYYMTVDGIRKGMWADVEMPPQGEVFADTFARKFPRRSLFRMELIEYEAWKTIGFHDPKLDLYEDFDMRIRLTKKLQTIYCDEPLSEIRLHNAGLSSSPASEHLYALEYIYKKNCPLLDDLDTVKRKNVERSLAHWIAGIAERAARQALTNNEECSRKVEALRYYLRCLKYKPTFFNRNLLARIILPTQLYRALIKTYRGIRRA